MRFAHKPKNMNKHKKAQKRLHRIAFKIYIDLVKQLNPIPKKYKEELDFLYRTLTQQRDDKNKVYSIHEPETLCISKGKEHKPYEFGNKSSFAYTRESGIIVGAMAIDGNVYDGRTLKPQLDQVKELTDGKIRKVIVDKGYKVPGGIPGIDSVMPKLLKGESYYKKKKREERCRSRAGIEGLISHLKHDHRMIRNYLSGTAGNQINTLLAAAAYNMKKWMRIEKQKLLDSIFGLIYQWLFLVPVICKPAEYKKNGY
jgi:IS5 family transposase